MDFLFPLFLQFGKITCMIQYFIKKKHFVNNKIMGFELYFKMND